jgi:hypothetical protein
LDQWGDVTPDYKLCQEFFLHSANFQAGSGIFVRPLPFRIPSGFAMRECTGATPGMLPARNLSNVGTHCCLKQRTKGIRTSSRSANDAADQTAAITMELQMRRCNGALLDQK